MGTEKPRLVLDTNVLVSALGWNGPERRVLELCIGDELGCCISPDMWAELQRVMDYPKLGFTIEQKAKFLNMISRSWSFVYPENKLDVVVDDPNDNMVLECAEAAHARVIISGDKHLLSLERYGDILIIKAADFLTIMGRIRTRD